jgi:hypothetical protein
MKKLLVLTFILPFSFMFKAQVSVEVQQPELNILYANYDNIIIPTAEGFKNITLSAPGCRVTPTTYNGKKGYEVQPGAGMRTVTISSSGKDAQGKIVSFGAHQYKVKVFPSPRLYNESISKTNGAKIEVGFGLECPLNIDFEVTKIEINNQFINGSVVSADIIKDLEVGKLTAIFITVMNMRTKQTDQISGSIQISN